MGLDLTPLFYMVLAIYLALAGIASGVAYYILKWALSAIKKGWLSTLFHKHGSMPLRVLRSTKS
jgi:hypothetical protein